MTRLPESNPSSKLRVISAMYGVRISCWRFQINYLRRRLAESNPSKRWEA